MKRPSITLLGILVLCATSFSGTEDRSSIARAESNLIQNLVSTLVQLPPATHRQALESSPSPPIEQLNRKQFPLQLLRTGTFHGNEIQAQSGQKWMGLFVTPNGFQLLSTTITVGSVHDPILDANQTEATGKEVLTDQPHNAVFLVDGALDFKPGPVQTVFHGWTKLIPNSSLEDNSIRLSLGLSDDAMQGSFYSLALKKFDRGERTHYALSLFESGSQISQQIQLFEHCCDGTYPALLWAGDLDRDRKLDLLINATNHYNVTHPMLFLSSQAEDGRLVEAVAELRSVGC